MTNCQSIPRCNFCGQEATGKAKRKDGQTIPVCTACKSESNRWLVYKTPEPERRPMLLTVTDVAKQLRCSRNQVYNLKDAIHYYLISRGAIRFRQEDVDRYLSERFMGQRAGSKRAKPKELQCVRL